MVGVRMVNPVGVSGVGTIQVSLVVVSNNFKLLTLSPMKTFRNTKVTLSR